jgi:hypothetical protein
MVQQSHLVSFTKKRIIQLWKKEQKSLAYLLPLAKNQSDFLTLGFQMVGRMKPVLEQGYKEDHPNRYPYMVDMIEWMYTNGWEEMAEEFEAFFTQIDECMREAQQPC